MNPITLFNKIFFPETSPVRIAFLRIALVATWMFFLKPIWEIQDLLGSHLARLTNNDSFTDPQVMIQALAGLLGEDMVRSPGFFYLVVYGSAVMGVLALVGLFTRTSLFLYALGHMILVTHAYSYGEKHHPEAIYLLTLMLFSFAPCGKAMSLDSWFRTRRGETQHWGPTARSSLCTWPLITAQLCICMAYLCAGLCKLKIGGLDWFNGYTLQTYLLQDGVLHDRPLGVWLSRYRLAGIVMAVGAVAFELSFFVVMFSRRSRWLIFPAGIGMHMGIFILQAAPFFTFMILYSLWIPWEKYICLDAGIEDQASTRVDTAPPTKTSHA